MNRDTFLHKFGALAHGPNGVANLRKVILSLAIKGKLSSFSGSDKPVQKLMEEIQLHQTALYHEKLIRKPVKFDQVQKDLDIPAHWLAVYLGKIGDWGAGATPNRKHPEYYGGNIPWFKSGELTGKVIYSSNETITNKALLSTSVRLDKVGDVLIAMYGATIGKTSIMGVEGTTNQAVCACTPYEGIDNRYLQLSLKALKSEFVGQGAGGAQPNISRVKIINTPWGLPPLEEQKRIVAKVDELMALCDELEQQQNDHVARKRKTVKSTLHHLVTAPDNAQRQPYWNMLSSNWSNWFDDIECVNALRSSIINEAVRGRLSASFEPDISFENYLTDISKEKDKIATDLKITRIKPTPPMHENAEFYEIKDKWVWVRFAEISLIRAGVTKGRKLGNRPVKSIPYLRVANVQRGALDLSLVKKIELPIDELEKFALKAGDILQIEGGDWDKVGRAAIWNEELEYCAHQNHVFSSRALGGILPQYIEMYMNSPVAQEYFQGCSKQTTNLASINKTQLSATPVPLPPLAEQKRIVAMVDEMMALCDELEVQVSEGERLKEALMQSLIHHIAHETEVVQNDENNIPNTLETKSAALEIDNVIPIAQATPKTTKKPSKPKNDKFEEAVLVGAVVHAFFKGENGGEPMGNFRIQKAVYFARRHMGEDLEVQKQFLRKAAGPYNPSMKYSGGIKIAKTNGYIKEAKGRFGYGHITGSGETELLDYMIKYDSHREAGNGVNAAAVWVRDTFKYMNNEEWELIATVDYAVMYLQDLGIQATAKAVLDFIGADPEWHAKVDKLSLTEAKVQTAIKKVESLFPNSGTMNG